MKKIIKAAYFNPLTVYLLTIFYGLLKIDFGDNDRHVAYGWLYIMIFMWIFAILYLISYLRLVLYLFKTLKQREGQRRYLIAPLVIFTILSLLALLSAPLSVMLPLYGLGTYSVVAFTIATLGLAITGYLKNRHQEATETENQRKKKSVVASLIALAIVIVPILSWWLVDQRLEFSREAEYQEILETAYQAKKSDYQTELLAQWKMGDDEVGLTFILKEGNYEIPARAKLSRNNQGEFEVYESTYVNLNSNYRELATIQVSSQEAADLLKAYVEEVKASLNRLKAEENFIVGDKRTARTEYDLPHFTAVNFNWETEFPLEIKEKLDLAKASKEVTQQEFDGWVSLTLPDLMSAGILIAELQVDYDWESHEEREDFDTSELDLMRQELADALVKELDYSKLKDGQYNLTVVKDQLLVVKSGKLVQVTDVPSRGLVSEFKDKTRSTSSSFTKW